MSNMKTVAFTSLFYYHFPYGESHLTSLANLFEAAHTVSLSSYSSDSSTHQSDDHTILLLVENWFGVYSFPRAAITKHHKLGGLKPQQFIHSQFWRLEVQNEDIGRPMFPLKALGKNPLLLS